ncbi:baseplate wedge protein [Vibrio phage vB_VhaM_VH-8]|nr:baseplate wedge protein [Vibrio phage vB_VhaM_VH-8]
MDIKFDQQTFDIVLVEDGSGLVDLDITTDSADDLMQRLFLRLKTYPRDLFWNINYGIDYLNTIFGKNRPKGTVDIILKNEINKEPMVESIDYFESEIFNYTYACKFRVRVIDEPTVSTYYILTNENGVILTNQDGDRLTATI